MTTVTRIVTLDPSGSIILTTLTSDRGIKAEGENVTTVTRIVTLDPSGSIILTTLTSDRGIKAEGKNATTVSYEDRDILDPSEAIVC